MGRTVYSLVLADDIVAAVDRLAYERSTSRSNLVNQILAEYLSCPTPEMRMKSIFDSVEQMIAELDSFQVQFQPSDAMISMRSALHYRYNPTIRYVLELYRETGPTVGELRVSARTQSPSLIQALTGFFTFWAELEESLIGSRFPADIDFCRVESGRYVREFLTPREEALRTEEGVANAIADYIQFFDTSLKRYFAGSDDPESICADLEDAYRSHMKHAAII
jgi:hypothetical protein